MISSLSVYRSVYEYLFPDLFEKFVYASKCEQLQVVKSFRPCFTEETMDVFAENELSTENVIYTGGRIPSYGYIQLDQRLFEENGVEYTPENLYKSLFWSEYSDMGML